MSVTKYFFNKATALALVFAICCGIWVGYKVIEPIVHPVVNTFTIDETRAVESGVLISGSLNKVRDCKFIQLVAYSGDEYVHVDFSPSKAVTDTSRRPRYQDYGPWLLSSHINTVTLYVTHDCSTGLVTSEVYNGSLITKPSVDW